VTLVGDTDPPPVAARSLPSENSRLEQRVEVISQRGYIPSLTAANEAAKQRIRDRLLSHANQAAVKPGGTLPLHSIDAKTSQGTSRQWSVQQVSAFLDSISAQFEFAGALKGATGEQIGDLLDDSSFIDRSYEFRNTHSIRLPEFATDCA